MGRNFLQQLMVVLLTHIVLLIIGVPCCPLRFFRQAYVKLFILQTIHRFGTNSNVRDFWRTIYKAQGAPGLLRLTLSKSNTDTGQNQQTFLRAKNIQNRCNFLPNHIVCAWHSVKQPLKSPFCFSTS